MPVERVSLCLELQTSFWMFVMHMAAKRFIIIPPLAGKRLEMLLGEPSLKGISRAIHPKRLKVLPFDNHGKSETD